MEHGRTASPKENGPSGSTPPPSAEGVEFVKPEDLDYEMDCLLEGMDRAIERMRAGDDRGGQGPSRDEVLSSSRGKKAEPPSSAPSPPKGGGLRSEDVVIEEMDDGIGGIIITAPPSPAWARKRKPEGEEPEQKKPE